MSRTVTSLARAICRLPSRRRFLQQAGLGFGSLALAVAAARAGPAARDGPARAEAAALPGQGRRRSSGCS